MFKLAISLVVVALALLIIFMSGCNTKKEVIVDPYNRLPRLERVVIEGPGNDMVGVEVKVVHRLDPLLPEPWNTIIALLVGGLAYAAVMKKRSK